MCAGVLSLKPVRRPVRFGRLGLLFSVWESYSFQMCFGILIFRPIMSVIRSVIATLSSGFRLTRHVRPAVEFVVSSMFVMLQLGRQLESLSEYLLVNDSLHVYGQRGLDERMATRTMVFQIVEMNAIVLPMTRCLSLMINHVNAHDATLKARR